MTQLFDQLRRALLPLDDALHHPPLGDFALNPQRRADFITGPLKPAAVLVPLIMREEGVTMLLTRRAETLPRHAGQVAFPGGRVDAQDTSLLDTALRECEEEIGLAPTFITPLGALDPHETGTGYLVAPFVGLVATPFEVTPDPSEVAAIFEVPLAFLLDRANHKDGVASWKDRDWRYTSIFYLEHRIWGATASIIVNLCDRLARVAEPAS